MSGLTPDGQSNAPVRITTAIGGGAGMAIAMLVGRWADVQGFWPGTIGVCVGIVAGILLGRLGGSLLFNRPPKGP
jgi:hypothetical protein